jgi:hypothetical protein
VKLIKEQLTSIHRLKENKHFEIDGIPVSYEQADILSVKDKHQFQHWLVEQVGGFPTVKKSNDKGIDGRLYIKTNEGLKEMVLSVKGGKSVSTDEIRELSYSQKLVTVHLRRVLSIIQDDFTTVTKFDT